MNSEETSTPNPFSVLGVASALIIGTPLWLLLAMLLHDNPMGVIDGASATVILAPIIGFSIPSALSMFGRSPGLSLWVLALAPLLSVVNIAACIVTIAYHPTVEAMPWIFSAIWVVPFAIVTYQSAKKRLAKDVTQ
jgi:hypothetical protein